MVLVQVRKQWNQVDKKAIGWWLLAVLRLAQKNLYLGYLHHP